MFDRVRGFLLFAAVVLLGQGAMGTGEKIVSGSPLDALEPHIRQLTTFGQRADFSHDGKRILFLEKTFGDVYEVEIASGQIRPLTHHYYHEGYTRALYLANGDILLSGARQFDANDPGASRDQKNAELWVLKKNLSGPPVALGEHCSEGPAVSRKRMHLIWTFNNAFYQADIVYENGAAKMVKKKKIFEATELPFQCAIEMQNLRPPDEKYLTFSAYGYNKTDAMLLNLETGKAINLANAPDSYDEPEGIFPDGIYTLIESDAHNPKGTQYIDIYKLALDGSGERERMTFFSNFAGYKSSNPVVSDDGKYIAFQMAKIGDKAGVGRGLLLFDIKKFEQEKTK